MPQGLKSENVDGDLEDGVGDGLLVKLAKWPYLGNVAFVQELLISELENLAIVDLFLETPFARVQSCNVGNLFG